MDRGKAARVCASCTVLTSVTGAWGLPAGLASRAVGSGERSSGPNSPARDQVEGIAAVKARDIYRGRRRILSQDDVGQAQARVAGGVPKAVIARDLGVHRSALLRRAFGR